MIPDDEKAKDNEEGNGDKGKAGDDASGAKEEENAGDAAASKDGEGASSTKDLPVHLSRG